MGRHDPLEAAVPTAFDWPDLPRAEADAAPARADGWRIVLPTAAGPLAASEAAGAVEIDGPTVALAIRGPGQRAVLDMPLAILAWALQVPERDLAALAPPARAIAAEHALSPALDALEAAWDAAFACDVAATQDGLGETLTAWLAPEDPEAGHAARQAARLRADPETAARLRQALAGHRVAARRPDPPDAIPFAVAILAPPLTMDRGGFEDLVPGDALILPDGWDDPPAARLCVADRLVAPLADRPGRPVLRGPLGPHPSKETDMTRPAGSATPPAPDAKDVPTDALPVEIGVELDRAEMTLGQLNALDSGSILPFERTFSNDVRLTANGAPFAEGELVRLGDRIGVRITARR